MSSSRRSSRRSSSSKQIPAWRSLSLSKNSASAAVSKVFAQPEHGKPLESAASKLPAAMLDDAASITSRKREDSESLHDLKDEADVKSVSGETGRSEGTQEPREAASAVAEQYLAMNEVPLTESPSSTSPVPTSGPSQSSAAIPFPSTSQTESSASSQKSTGGSSWFSSLSRARGKTKSFSSATGKTSEEQSSKPGEISAPPAPIIEIQPSTPGFETPPADPQSAEPLNPCESAPEATPTATAAEPAPASPEAKPSEPQPIPGHRSKRSWFASPTGSPHRTQPSSPLSRAHSPHPPTSSPKSPRPRPRVQQMPSMPSSIDEEVPQIIRPSPPDEPPHAVVQHTCEPAPKISSLNPATSRFTLTLPLLGRPKVPLEKAVAAAQAEDVRDPGPPKEPLETPIEEAIKVAQEQDLRQEIAVEASGSNSNGNAELREGESAVVKATSTTNTSMTVEKTAVDTMTRYSSSSSWWDYVGWGYTTSSQASQSGSATPQDAIANTSSGAPSAQPHSPSTSTAGSTESAAESDEHDTVKDPAPPKASSIFSADTARSQGSAWYSPWSWYYTPSRSMSEEQPSAHQGSEKTESERVKEEALRRSESEPPVKGEKTASPDSQRRHASDINPIESSITINRSGWISFLASRALMMKTVAGSDAEVRRDENGVEVMDIDEEETPKEQSTQQAVVATRQQAAAKVPPSPTPSTPASKSGPEPKKSGPPAPPITESDSIKRETTRVGRDKHRKDKQPRKASSASPASSKKSGATTPTSPRAQPPNLVLPTWADTFHVPPRSVVPPPPPSTLRKTMRLVSAVGGALFAQEDQKGKGKGKARDHEEFLHYGKELPRAWDVLGERLEPDVLRGCKKVVVIGVHGWFPGAVMRTVLGEPTGTSSKFVNMMCQALEDFEERHQVRLEKVTQIPLEGEGTIGKRVERLYNTLTGNKEWMDDIHSADAIFVATHSQGSIVSTHVLDRLIRDGHIRTRRSVDLTNASTAVNPGGAVPAVGLPPQRVCCLALCGIHLGPLRYLSSSSLLQPYIQYFESAAAKELFDFQDTESQVSKDYVKALQNVTNHGTKMVYIASMNDQVVPVYSGLFTSASHPLILRALYIDGDAYHSSDFMSNLLVLLIRILNSGLSDSGLLVHLSEATAGSLSGVGHSTAYEELRTFSLAVDYLFLTNDGLDDHPELEIKPFNANSELNDYEIPWALRDLIADERVAYFFWKEFSQLRDAFDDWHPKTTILRDIKRKLQPIQRLPSASNHTSASKL
ncbi:hypothetical protein GLOTRDRAFT_138440 [Gloeophyllum trabeum ATCC 11539]|uniref:YMC020W-like alpha/beta hydrolase domain-containing protein n=1 Tax=Gloeophyllum trabeum (strain ATCC 11539 / FP-39264 / Madison 617) TaxID=670483 RepID=S7Q664_GLOTA|nr:uncharacterized protein GLOTRDRAFT_138440 [Gloeophyllum trabeum ATCC 11539]EPQ55541.1 hypothetical protein GLOTRDRAFT_138440 [Gloeophyllum trabeum ATCC 11539]